MKQKRLPLFVLCFVAGLLLSGCSEVTPPPESSYEPQTVAPNARTMTVERMDMLYETRLSAVMVHKRITNLYYKDVSGPLLTKNVQLNDRISAGQVLAEIDPELLQRELYKAELQDQVYTLQRDAGVLTSSMLALTASQYKMILDAAKTAYNEDPTPERKRVVDAAQLQYDMALVNQSMDVINKKISALNYEEFLFNYERIKDRLENCAMTAPRGGIIVSVDPIEVGETLNAGRYLYKYVSWDQMVFKVTTAQAVNLAGQSEITIGVNGVNYSAYHYVPVPGDEIYSQTDVKNTSLAYLGFHDQPPDVDLLLPQILSVRIEKKNTLYISKKCLRSVNGLLTTYRKTAEGFEQVIVTCGIESGDNVEILSGLSEGDVVAFDNY